MADVQNLWKPGGLQWFPDADNVGAPEGTLLRADNLVPDRAGSLSLRQGSEILYSGLGSGTGSVHTLYTAPLESGSTHRIIGADDTVAIDGSTQVTGVDGSGDLAVSDDAYQFFFARGDTKRKYDGTTVNNWSIAAPTGKPTLAAVASITDTVAAFNNSESPAVTVQEGSGTIGGVADAGGNANEATEVTPDGTSYRAVLQRLWTTDQDFDEVQGIAGTSTDLVDFNIKFADPRQVESVRVVFGLDDSSTQPFKDNRFEFEFDIKNGTEIPIKDLESESYAAYQAAVLNSLNSVRPSEITGISSPEQVKNILANIGEVPSPKSGAPADNVWGHLTVTRGQFKRIGNDASRGWDTVRGFKIVYKTLKGKTASMTIADALVVGGGDRALTGAYRCVVRAVRPFKDSNGNVVYYEKSPPSEQSDVINLNHQALQITLPSTMLTSLDSQVSLLWVYLFGGWLDSYYRFAVVPASASQGMTIDEIKVGEGASDLDSVVQRMRVPSWGFTYSQLNSSGTPEITATTDVTVTLRTSELEALTDNTRIEPYQQGAPSNIVDVAGPWNGRMFALTTEGYVYPSNIDDPSSFNSFQVIDLSRYGDPYWIAKTGNGMYVGMEKDIIFLRGDGANSPDLAQINLFPDPLDLGSPPIDAMHWVDGNSITYRTNDGPFVLTGSSVAPVELSGTHMLWRGIERHDIQLTLTGRFRCAVDNHMLYIQCPEETQDNAIYRYSSQHNQWSRLTFGQVVTWKSIFNEPDGTLIAGDAAGRLWKLESGVVDNSNFIDVVAWTAIEDGGNPLIYKDPMDLQVHMDSGNRNATVAVHVDGNQEAALTYTQASTAQPDVWRRRAGGITNFVKVQLRFGGTFDEFRLHGFNIAYRPRPQRMVRLETGYILPQGSQDFVWIQEIELDANATEDITFLLTAEDESSIVSDYTITVSPSERRVYRIPIPREAKGQNLRAIFNSATNTGSGNVGFEPYRVRVRLRSTGNEDRTRQWTTVWPVGNAP